MVKLEFTAIYKKRGSRYIAWVEEIPGVNTQGKTKKEVKGNLEEALLLILEANRRISAESNRGSITRELLRVRVPA